MRLCRLRAKAHQTLEQVRLKLGQSLIHLQYKTIQSNYICGGDKAISGVMLLPWDNHVVHNTAIQGYGQNME